MTPLAGWRPDADPTTPGIFTDCQHVVSTLYGYVGAPAPIAAAVASVGAAVRGAIVATDLSGNRAIYAGTQTKLYQLAGSAWVDQSAGALAAPVQGAISTTLTGGTLPAATYYYVITALNAFGETLASNEMSIATTGATSKIQVTWAAVAGATGFKVYRGTAAAGENIWFSLTPTPLYFTDIGPGGPLPTAGLPPTANTSGGYVGSSESRWSFCQFGDTTMASNLADPMQEKKKGASVFSAVPTAPKAKVIVSANNNFVLAFNTNEGTYGPSPDRWWCCAQNNQDDWAPNVSTGANTGRLIAGQGPITAAGTLGDYVVAYKKESLFLGSFVGSPVQWQWNMIPGGTAGCIGQDAWCNIGGAHFIVGGDMFWIFDGTRPQPFGLGNTRDWFYQNSSPVWRYRTQAIYDKINKLVRIAYPSVSSTGQLDATLTVNIATTFWSRDDNLLASFINFVQPGTTIDGMNTYAATINALPNVPVDSPFWSAGGESASYFDNTGKLWNLSGTTQASYIVTGDVGDDDGVSMIDHFRIRYSLRPKTASCTGQYKMNEGDAFVPGPVNAINDGKFDIRQSARFHRFRVDMTGAHTETAYDAQPRKAGMR